MATPDTGESLTECPVEWPDHKIWAFATYYLSQIAAGGSGSSSSKVQGFDTNQNGITGNPVLLGLDDGVGNVRRVGYYDFTVGTGVVSTPLPTQGALPNNTQFSGGSAVTVLNPFLIAGYDNTNVDAPLGITYIGAVPTTNGESLLVAQDSGQTFAVSVASLPSTTLSAAIPLTTGTGTTVVRKTTTTSPGTGAPAATSLYSAAACQLFGINIVNLLAAVIYVKMYNVAAVGSVNAGTTIPDHTFQIAASGSLFIRGADLPYGFSNGIVAIVTTVATDTGTQTAAGTLPIIELEFK